MQFLRGANFFLKGFSLMLKPKIRRFTLIPLIINITLFTSVIIIAYSYTNDLIASLTSRLEHWIMQLPNWLSWLTALISSLQWIIWPLFALSALFFLFFFFSMIANLIAAPFNGYLAEAVERYLTRKTQKPTEQFTGKLTGNHLLKDSVVAVIHELRKIGYFAVRALPLLLLFFIPVLNIAAPIFWLIFSSWMLAVEYLDYPMSNHHIPFKLQRKYHKRQRGLSFGFGTVVALANAIPILNFIVMPSAVAGATALYCQTHDKHAK